MSNTQSTDDELWYQHITEIEDEEEDTSDSNDITITTE